MRQRAIILFLLLLMAGCRSQSLIRPGDSLEVAFDKAYSLYEAGKWNDAVQAFETVISIGRGTQIGQDAQYYLAESHFNNRSWLLAASEYERYSRSFPDSPRREEVDFRAALCYYNLSPRYNIDQSHTRTAIERFRLFLARYPNSEHFNTADAHINELRNKLARKSYEAARFYMRNDMYEAAAVYFGLTIDRYPETEWAERALFRQIEAYILYADNSVPQRQEERYRKALESYETYLQLFPRGENRSDAEKLYDRIRDALRQYETQPEGEEVAADSTR